MNTAVLEGGFANPSHDASRAFRAIMTAMARPGSIHEIAGAVPPAPLSPAAGAVLLTLCDGDTGLYLAGDCDCEEVRAWVTFHIGAPIVGPSKAVFAIGSWEALVPLGQFAIGTSEYPDRSVTLIVERPTLEQTGATLKGPGIKESAQFSLPETAAFQGNRKLFPLGLDFIFTAHGQVAALPRSTEVI